MNSVRFATISDLSTGLRKRQFSALELAEATCDLLASEGPRYNAVATVTRERARTEAARADRLRPPGRSILHGIPYGAKDLVSARGAPTTWGAPPFRNQVIDSDATSVRRRARAGTVLAAKLAMVELAGGGGYRYPSASLQGPGRNPWNLDHWTGGSSSGSGAAVGAGLVPFAIGSETSGSIATPAAFCGVTGLRPTYGLVSRAGAMPLSWTLDKLGPLAHTATDCGIVLEAIAGRDAADPTSSRHGFHPLDGRQAKAAIRKVRIGIAEEDFAQAPDSTRPSLMRGLAEFKRIAPRLSRATIPDLPYGAMVSTVIGAEAASIFASLIEGPQFEDLVDPKQRAALRAGMSISARDYLQAMRLRSVLQEDFRAIFGEVDIIVTVGRPRTAPPLNKPLEPWTPELTTGNQGIVAAGNLAGIPGIFFPCGVGTDGLPVGLQLVGPAFSEPLLIALAVAYQQETAYHLLRPPVLPTQGAGRPA